MPNTKTQKYSEPKKSETFDLSESDTSCSKEQGSKPNDDQNTGTNYCKNTDKACIVNTGLPIVEDTEHVQVESMCSGDAKVNEWNNNLKTEVIEKDNGSVVVSCNKNNHSNDGCNQDDAESNHGDAESNHGDKTPVEHKSEVDVNAENAENETKEAVPLLPGKNCQVLLTQPAHFYFILRSFSYMCPLCDLSQISYVNNFFQPLGISCTSNCSR